MNETTASKKKEQPAPPRRICPLRKMKLISDIAALGEVDAPCIEKGCAWWHQETHNCAMLSLVWQVVDLGEQVDKLRETLKERLPRGQ